jgi:4-amino-4-deoxy-L-arabinose transferase-like glycosyltransferase
LTARQKRLVLALSAAIALTRFAAVAPSLFDWDEALFVSGVRDYDVGVHHPHPPGYPLFIAPAKALHALGLDEFRALQALVLLGACTLFPALLLLALELGFDFTTAILGAIIFAFLPHVWLYGGTAFSDVPAMTLTFLACALLLRGRRDARAYVLGALVLGIATGIRTPSLIIGAVPALLATWHRLRARSWRAVVAAIVLGGGIAAASYLGAALASTGVADFMDTLRAQSRYVREIDSWRNPERGTLGTAAELFFLHPFQYRDVLNVLAGAAVLSLLAAAVRKRATPWLTFAIFAPLALLTWLDFDVKAAGRYSIGFMAAHALLGADGFRILGRKPTVQVALCAALTAIFVYSVMGAVQEQRTTVPPPVAALRFAAEHVDPALPLYVHGSMRPHAEALIPRRQVSFFTDLATVPGGAWVVDERTRPGATNFVRERLRTWKVLRRRNFEAAVFRK